MSDRTDDVVQQLRECAHWSRSNGPCDACIAAALRAYAEEAARTRLWEKGDLNHLSCGCWFRACSATHEKPVRDAEEARREDVAAICAACNAGQPVHKYKWLYFHGKWRRWWSLIPLRFCDAAALHQRITAIRARGEKG